MKQFCVALALALAACSAPSPAYDPAAVRSEVTALVQRWSDSGEAGDWDAVADTYADAEGFAWVERGQVAYADHAAIVAGLDSVRQSGARITNDVSNIVVTPLSTDAAAVRANYALSLSSEAFSFSSSGVLSGVAIRQGETWRFLQGALTESPAEAPQPPAP